MVHKREMKAAGQSPRIPNHGGGRALQPSTNKIRGAVIEDDIVAIEECGIAMAIVVREGFVRSRGRRLLERFRDTQ